MNGYVCFYNGKRHEVKAKTSFDAHKQAVAFFKPPRSKMYTVSVMLAEIDGVPVVHTADF